MPYQLIQKLSGRIGALFRKCSYIPETRTFIDGSVLKITAPLIPSLFGNTGFWDDLHVNLHLASRPHRPFIGLFRLGLGNFTGYKPNRRIQRYKPEGVRPYPRCRNLTQKTIGSGVAYGE